MNEIKKPIQKRAIEKKQQLIQAARFVFNEKGYYDTYIKDITTKAGISTGLFYKYFKDKEIIYTTVIKDLLDEEVNIVIQFKEDLLKLSDTKMVIRQYILRRVESLQYIQTRNEVLLKPLNNEIKEYVQQKKELYMNAIADIVLSLHPDILQDNLKIRVLMIWNTLYMNLLEIHTTINSHTKELYIDSLTNLIFKLILTK